MQHLEKLKTHNFTFKKRFGQNFIFDSNLLSAIVADAGVEKSDHVVEVGCGAGTLTTALAKAAESVTGFEIDNNLKPILDEVIAQNPNLNVVYGDILKLKLSEYLPQRSKFKVVANLPYYITTPVMFYFLEQEGLQSITVMVQKEVAERFCAKPNTPEYGAVTAQLAAYGTPKITRIVNRKLFTPAPNVDSAMVRLDIAKRTDVKNFKILQKTIATSFAMRRKTLINNLCSGFNVGREVLVDMLKNLGFRADIRGETLGIDDFVRLANTLEEVLTLGSNS